MTWLLAISLIASLAAACYTYWKVSSLGVKHPEWGDVPTAEEGRPIPLVFGTVTIANPNIGYFGGTFRDGATYGADILFGLCEGPIDRISRIYVGEKEVWSGYRLGWLHGAFLGSAHFFHSFQDDKCGGAFLVREGNPATATDDGSVEPVTGTSNYLAQKMGLTDNKGPFYKGVATVELRHFALGNTPYVKPIAFRVQRILLDHTGAAQWYAGKAAIRIGRDRTDLWKYLVQAAGDFTDCSPTLFDDSEWSEGEGGIGNAPYSNGDFVESKPYVYGYKTPPVRTSINGVGGLSSRTGGDISSVVPGTKLWLRQDLGGLPAAKLLGVRVWHDGTARLWWNGTEVTLHPIESSSDSEHGKFNSAATITADMIHPTMNVAALKVTRGYDNSQCSEGQFIYAGLQIGPGSPTQCAATVGMNGVHVIRECLLLMGYTSDDIGDWGAVADTIYAEHLGVSFMLSEQTEAIDFISEVLRHINGVLYVDRSTGKFELKLIRADYSLGALPVLDYSNTLAIENLSQKTIAELVNAVTLTYTSAPAGKRASLTVHDAGLVSMQGSLVAEQIELRGLDNDHAAQIAAWRNLRALSSPLRNCEVQCTRYAAQFYIGQPVLLDWPALYIDEVVFRVIEIDTGDGIDDTVKLKLLEDIFDTPDKPLITVGGIQWPTQTLGPLPGSTVTKDYVTAVTPDPLNGGAVLCVFAAPGEAGTLGDFVASEGGILTRSTAGPLDSTWFDGVATGATNYATYQQLIGKIVLVYKHGSLIDNEHAGAYIVEDIGCEWYQTGDPPAWAMASTHARLRRVARFSTDASYKQGLTFFALQGTVYGGQYLVLDNAATVLEVTEQSYTASASHTYADETPLLTREELTEVASSVETVIDTVSTDDDEVFPQAFETREILGLTGIPAGKWPIRVEGAWLTADAPGETNAIGLSVWAIKGDDSRMLFESIGPSLHNTVSAPLAWEYDAPAFVLAEDETIGGIYTAHTSAGTAVEFNMIYNSTNHGTGFSMPAIKTKDKIDPHIYGGRRRPEDTAATFVDGVIVVPKSTGPMTVTIPAGSTVIGIAAPAPADGDLLILTVEGATNEDHIVFQHGATVAGSARAFYLASVAGMGVDFSEGLHLLAARSRVAFVYYALTNEWQLLMGVMS